MRTSSAPMWAEKNAHHHVKRVGFFCSCFANFTDWFHCIKVRYLITTQERITFNFCKTVHGSVTAKVRRHYKTFPKKNSLVLQQCWRPFFLNVQGGWNWLRNVSWQSAALTAMYWGSRITGALIHNWEKNEVNWTWKTTPCTTSTVGWCNTENLLCECEFHCAQTAPVCQAVLMQKAALSHSHSHTHKHKRHS